LIPVINGGLGGGGPPGGLLASLLKPCVYYLGAKYQYDDTIYGKDPQIDFSNPANAIAAIDS
jgi:hypothetical protein